MIVTKRHLDRRSMMRGAGAVLALPFLDAMVPALASAAATRPPTRLGFVYVPNGILGSAFWPATVGRNFEMTRILAPLKALQAQLTIIGGLSNSQAEAVGVAGGPHTRCGAAWLSGIRPKRTEGADIELAKTVDQFAADVLGRDTPLRSLELGVDPTTRTGNCDAGYSCAYLNSISWRTPTMPLPGESNPRAVFERLFGEGASSGERADRMRTHRSILDLVAGDLSRVRRKLGAADAVTLDEYLGAVRDVETRLEKAEKSSAAQPDDLMQAPQGVPTDWEQHVKLMFDLLLLAYRGDVTRVSTFQMTRELSNQSYQQIGVVEGHHDSSHHGNIPKKMEAYTKVGTYHMSLFAAFLAKLQATPDGDGSLLDHSLIVYGSGLGDGDLHSPHDLQVVLAGGGSGTVKPGQYLRYSLDTPMMNLGLSLLDKVGARVEKISDSSGPLAGL